MALNLILWKGIYILKKPQKERKWLCKQWDYKEIAGEIDGRFWTGRLHFTGLFKIPQSDVVKC